MPAKIVQIITSGSNCYDYTLFALDDKGQVWGLRGYGSVRATPSGDYMWQRDGWIWEKLPQSETMFGFKV